MKLRSAFNPSKPFKRLSSTPWPQPDFIRSTRGPSLAMVLALAAVLLSLGVASLQAWRGWQSLEQARWQNTAAKQQLEAARNQRQTPSASRSPQADMAAATEARKLLRGLRPAWSAALLAVEDLGSPELRWLGLDFATDSGAVHLKGTSSGLEPIMGGIERLSHWPGWTQIALSQLQTANNLDPASPVQFELKAQFDPGAAP